MLRLLASLPVQLTLALLAPLGAASAQIGFTEVGPVRPDHGFPEFYGDASGQRMDLCITDPLLCAEGLDAVVLADPTLPFPANYAGTFPEEAFYNRCVGRILAPNGTRALVVIALESAFVNGPVVAGDQVVFGRIRIRISNLVAGQTYTVTTPVGTYTFVATNRAVGINFTDDIGILTPGVFTTALGSHVGPFLTWDSDLPILDASGREYVGDPLIDHTITGSPSGTNFFRVEGPGVGGPGVNRIETDLFSVIGVRHVEAVPAVVTADFGAAPLSGTAPLLVAFNDLSTGAVSSWSWSFGDGSSSTLQNPTHSYAAAGTYSVSLTASGPGGTSTLAKPALIAVAEPPPPPASGLTLANPVPGLAGVANTLTVTGATPGRRIAFYTGLVLGGSVVNSGACPGGIPIGLGSPFRFLGTAPADAAGRATLVTTPPAGAAGQVFHFQAVDSGACASSNVVSDQL